MSAPATEQPPVEEQPTQPLPLEHARVTERSWLMSEASEALIPATILAAVAAGELLRALVLATDGQRSDFAITAAAGLYLVVWVLMFIAPTVLNGTPWGKTHIEREH